MYVNINMYPQSDEIDILKLFFEDVSKLKIVRGKNDYLPLTRRIKRYVTLSSLLCNNLEDTIRNIIYTISKTRNKLAQYKFYNHRELDIIKLRSEFDSFLDDPQINVAPTLAYLFDKYKKLKGGYWLNQFEKLGWRFFYLLSLIPPNIQPDYLNYKSMDEFDISKYLDDFDIQHDMVRKEGKEAQILLVEGTLRYVIHITCSFIDQGIPYLDLVQEGYTGLIQATERYDERRGHFQQFASYWIRQKVMGYIANNRNLIRTPVHFGEFAKTVDAKIKKFEIQRGYHPQNHEIKKIISDLLFIRNKKRPVSIERIDNQLNKYYIAKAQHYSLERFAVRDDENGLNYFFDDLLVSQIDSEHHIDSLISRNSCHTIINECLTENSLRDRRMFIMRFCNEYTLEKIGNKFGVTRERVRQIVSSMVEYFQRHYRIKRKDFKPYSERNLTLLTQYRRKLLESNLEILDNTFEIGFEENNRNHINYLINRYVEKYRQRIPQSTQRD